MKPSTAFTVGFLCCYAIGAVLTYRALVVMDFESIPPLRHSLTWPSTLAAASDAIRDARHTRQ